MSLLLASLFSAIVSAMSSFDGYYFVNDCIVFNLSGKIELTLPGQYCHLHDDGTFISHSEHGVFFSDSEKKIKWQRKGHFHHRLSLSHDKERLLILSSEFSYRKGQSIRDDKFIVLSRETGKIIHSALISELVPEQELLIKVLPQNWSITHTKVQIESGHFNSFYEIPKVKERPDLPWLKEGNYVVNSLFLGVYILSADLKKVLHHFKYDRSVNHQVHDVQVLPSGSFFLFNNVVKSDSLLSSAVEEVDPGTLKPVYVYGLESGHHFYASHRSGAQIISDDLFAFSLQWQGAYVVSKKTGKVILSNNLVNIQNDNYISTQHVRFLNLKEFFKNWRR